MRGSAAHRYYSTGGFSSPPVERLTDMTVQAFKGMRNADASVVKTNRSVLAANGSTRTSGFDGRCGSPVRSEVVACRIRAK